MTGEEALALIDGWEMKIQQVHDAAKADTSAGYMSDIQASVPSCLIEYADRYASTTGDTRRQVIEEALCLFQVIREQVASKIRTRRPVRRYRSRRPRRT